MSVIADDPIIDQEESNNVTEATAWLDITDRMKVIDYCRKKKRLSPEAVNVLRQRSRLSSQRVYNEYWKNWTACAISLPYNASPVLI
ncbi:hypothetical protein RMCBS344292_19343 [Rhizopus microsporus]|nr:hypothetical protein RMCBS344292_19343 [Rhizopus microsporus]